MKYIFEQLTVKNSNPKVVLYFFSLLYFMFLSMFFDNDIRETIPSRQFFIRYSLKEPVHHRKLIKKTITLSLLKESDLSKCFIHYKTRKAP